MMKNILVISPFFYPEPISTGKFNTDMVVALEKEGHKVTVLCSHPLYPKWVPEESSETLSGIVIKRGGLNVKYSKKTIIRRIVLELWFAGYVFRNIFKLKNKVDVIIPVFPPSLAFFLIIPFLSKNLKKVGIVHDLQEIYSKEKKGVISSIISFFINKIEGTTFRCCNELIFLSDEMKTEAQKSYNLKSNKLKVQYPFATINSKNKTSDLGDLFIEDKKHIVYSGALGEKQNPIGLYDFFNYASNELSDTHFHVFSQGYSYEELKNKNKNHNILFHDLVPRVNIEELYRRSTVQIIPQLSGTSRGSLPSKLPNILASGCKVFIITDPDSEIEKIFKKFNLKKIVTNWDKKNMLEEMKSLIFDDNDFKENQIDVANKIFDIKSMVEKIIEE